MAVAVARDGHESGWIDATNDRNSKFEEHVGVLSSFPLLLERTTRK